MDHASLHKNLLNKEWQWIDYCENQRKLKKGQVLIVID